MTKQPPKIIEDVGFAFSWDNKKVWSIDLPVEEMSIEELEWHFDIPFWDSPEGYYNLKPNEVLNKPDIYKIEFERIINSDLSYPLDIMFWKSRWLLLDGLHRLVKAKQRGHNKVKVRKFSEEHIPLIRKRTHSLKVLKLA